MAELRITIGALSRARTADNDARAAEVVSAYADSIGATGTNAQRADAVLLALERHMRHQAHQHRRRVKQATANEEVNAELTGLYWNEPEPQG